MKTQSNELVKTIGSKPKIAYSCNLPKMARLQFGNMTEYCSDT